MLLSIRRLSMAGLLLGVLLLGCRKVDFGPDEGYTPRDARNVPMGAADDTDWTSDKDWKKVERELFKDSGVDLKQTQQGLAVNLNVFPNPVAEQGSLQISPNTQRGTIPALQGQLVIVDQKYRVITTLPIRTNAGVTLLRLDFPADKYENGKLYRLYYIFFDDNKELYLKGHGDIKIAR